MELRICQPFRGLLNFSLSFSFILNSYFFNPPEFLLVLQDIGQFQCHFQRIGPQADSFTELRCVSVCLMSPFHVVFSRPLIGPQVTRSDPGLSLVNPTPPYSIFQDWKQNSIISLHKVRISGHSFFQEVWPKNKFFQS